MHMRFSDSQDAGRRPVRLRRRCREGGQVLMLYTLILPFLLLPLVGMAMDGARYYSITAKLQLAVDGAALAGARSLATGGQGLTQAAAQAAQKNNACYTAGQIIRANFQAGYFGSYNLYDGSVAVGSGCPNNGFFSVTDDTNFYRTVFVKAVTFFHPNFMSILGLGQVMAFATGSATRRDTVLVLIIDRSGSMSDELSAVRPAATSFVKQFSAGTDKLGMVLIGRSSIVAYPPGDWNKGWFNGTEATLTGPDVKFQSGDNTDMIHEIATINSGSNTGTADALMLAYEELKAANVPLALNAIVLYTDGMPNGITANFNGPTTVYAGTSKGNVVGTTSNGAANTSTYYYTAVRSGAGAGGNTPNNLGPASPCSNKKDGQTTGTPSNTSMIGSIEQNDAYKRGGDVGKSNGNTNGINPWAQFQIPGKTYTVANQISSPGTYDGYTIAHGAGCSFTDGNNPPQDTNSMKFALDVVIPDYDIWGNSTAGITDGLYSVNDYKSSSIYNNAAACNKEPYTPNTYVAQPDLNNDAPQVPDGAASGCQIGYASWNAADMAVKNIREDNFGLKPVIFTMGYNGAEAGCANATCESDTVLMVRMANTNPFPGTGFANSVFNSAYPQGQFLQMNGLVDIQAAFDAVASALLRLTQ
jgi:hypothetical protein